MVVQRVVMEVRGPAFWGGPKALVADRPHQYCFTVGPVPISDYRLAVSSR